jgi:MFS superfamily sulfate permease-like transporter
MPEELSIKEKLTKDLPASVVVFLVALPLCLGIAIASGAPVFSGIISGIVGGIIVGYLSGSSLSVSGPAAGLTVVVLDAIKTLGTFEAFLLAVCLSGIIQILLGFLKAGLLANFFPSSVIKGMLASIGLLLILKQLPHALGYDFDFEGDESFNEQKGHNTFSDIYYAFQDYTSGAIVISLISFFVMLVWDKLLSKTSSFFKLIPGALMAVMSGIFINFVFSKIAPNLELGTEHLVNLPTGILRTGIHQLITFPDFSAINSPKIATVAFTIALIGSIESLLSVEAIDKLDPQHRTTPLNRELFAQGVGNIFSGLLGGIPVTAVILRSSTNLIAGAASKFSAIFHGFLFIICIVFIPQFLNSIPMASLAALLILVGYKLAAPSLFISVYKKGLNQFIPFMVCIVSILFTNLLVGIGIGMLAGLFFILISNFQRTITVVNDKNNYMIRLRYNVSFLNKSILRSQLNNIPKNSHVIIDGTNAAMIDLDILETIEIFQKSAHFKNISVEIHKSNASINKHFRN